LPPALAADVDKWVGSRADAPTRSEAILRLVKLGLKANGEKRGPAEMISVLIGVLVIIVVGAICFWAIDRFATDRRLANLLKLLVVLICLGAILQRVLPLAGIYY
jgi:hypothetical protein